MAEQFNRNYRLGEFLPQKIAVVRSLPGLGDLLCSVPALRALRYALPNADITLIGLPPAKSFVERFKHYLDQWLEFPGYPGIPEVPLVPSRIASFLSEVQQQDFDLALQMHGNGSYINSFTLLLGAKQSAGFCPSRQYCLDRDRFLPYPDHEPEVWRHLRLLEFLGLPLQGDYLEFPLWQSDWEELETIAATDNRVRENYVCIHPGASDQSRRWPAQSFATVADALAAQGLRVILTGTAAETPLTEAVAQAMKFPSLDLAGKTSLGAIAALLKNARLLICNDTGVSHLAAALQVSSVVIFFNSDPQRWAPLDRQRHRVVVKSEQSNQGKDLPSPDLVLAQAFDLLQQQFAHA